MDLNEISGAVISAAMKVHSALGPGLLESTYEICLVRELTKRGMRVASQVPLPVMYDNVRLDAGYQLDLLVENAVIVELKAEQGGISELHKAQVLTYLKLTGKRLGIIINFNVVHLREGIKRLVNGDVRNPSVSSVSSVVNSP
jgi:GxxExxY protein